MMNTARILATMWLARWRALREDEGASTVEYTILVAVGILVAGTVATLIVTAVKNHDKTIK
jgi:Flp pilus assembly pilin Flp